MPIIVRDILSYLFWLAIVTIVLGIAAWVIVRYAPAKDPDTPPRLKPVRKQRKTKAQEGGTNA